MTLFICSYKAKIKRDRYTYNERVNHAVLKNHKHQCIANTAWLCTVIAHHQQKLNSKRLFTQESVDCISPDLLIYDTNDENTNVNVFPWSAHRVGRCAYTEHFNTISHNERTVKVLFRSRLLFLCYSHIRRGWLSPHLFIVRIKRKKKNEKKRQCAIIVFPYMFVLVPSPQSHSQFNRINGLKKCLLLLLCRDQWHVYCLCECVRTVIWYEQMMWVRFKF